MDEDFAVSRPLVRPGLPRIRFLFVRSRLRSTLPSDPASRRRPCASLALHLHQVVQGTCTPRLSNMLGTRRVGFAELVSRVTLGEVGIIFSYDVTRLSRNCSDWYQLLDLCGFRHCLIGDHDSIYDPSSINGRLLLGLKGQISELELHTIKARLHAGLINKARRGDLAMSLPVGLMRDTAGRVVVHPDQEVRDRIAFVFATFLRVRSIGG